MAARCLRHIDLRKDLIERQIEPRHARTHPGADRLQAGLLQHARFKPAGQAIGLLNGGTLGEPQIDQDLGPARIREELLLHLPMPARPSTKINTGDADGLPAVHHAPGDQPAKAGIERVSKISCAALQRAAAVRSKAPR